MKKLFLLLPFLALFIACETEEDDDLPQQQKLETPTLQSPANGALLQAATFDFPFSWSEVENATSYQLQIADNANFDNTGNINSSSNSINVTSSDIESGNTYFWRVRATDPDFTPSDFSQTFSFEYNDGSGGGGPTNVATLISPADNATVNTTRPTFTWSNTPLDGAALYQIQFAADLAFNTVFYTGQSVTNSFTVPQAIDPLAPYATLFWRVSVDGGTNWSAYFTLNIQ